ncbi:hypothetical protein L2E82_12741 [Cichorium intybus]|uniref:Uncharacterized protein n=1 Tax=Cichorium intybus TaxID=13427 RepID=A0ACB9GH18_CICIN|nr:hypothetical protein L2E82_12741 [Cichorium intybus]
MEKTTSSDEMPWIKENGEWEEQTLCESVDKVLMADEDLDDSDVDEQASSSHLKVPHDYFLYDLYHVPVTKENVDDQEIKDDVISDNEGILESEIEDDIVTSA